MVGASKGISWKYFKIELLLFMFICYIGPVFSDIEYSGYEEKNILNFMASFEYRLIYGTFSVVLYAAYYWLLLKPLVFNKRIFYLILSIFCFIAIYHLVNKYENWLVTKLPFVSIDLRLRAKKDYDRTTLHFVVSYALTRLVFTFIGFVFFIRSLQQDEEVINLKEQQLSAELTYLKAQLHPHFFFNTMNNIYALALKQSAYTAPLVAKLADMMRYILYEAEHKTVPLTKEVQFFTDYVDAEKIRQHASNLITFDVQGIRPDTVIEPLLLLPFIENAFKHGLHQKTDNGFVHLVICLADGELILQVHNSKPANAGPAQKGIGLQNAVKRLNLLYPEKYTMSVKDEPESYQLTLSLQGK